MAGGAVVSWLITVIWRTIPVYFYENYIAALQRLSGVLFLLRGGVSEKEK